MKTKMNGDTHRRSSAADDEIDLREIWNILLRNRLLIAGSVVVAVCLSVAYLLLSVPTYEGSTAIRISNEQRSFAVLDALPSLSQRAELATEIEELKSRTLAEAVVDSLRLQIRLTAPRRTAREEVVRVDRVSRSAPESEYEFARVGDELYEVRHRADDRVVGTFSVGEPVHLDGATVTLTTAAAEHDRLRIAVLPFNTTVNALRKSIEINRPNREASVIIVRYESADTILAHRIPNTVAQIYIQRRATIRNIETSSTVKFLQSQIDTISAQLAEAEEAVRRFRESHHVVSLEAESYMQVQEATRLQAQRDQLESERSALANLLDEVSSNATELAIEDGVVSSGYRRLLAFPSLLRHQTAAELFRSLTAAESELSTILRRRTMRDPDAQIMANRIIALEHQLRTVAETYHRGLSDQIKSLDETLERFTAELGGLPAKEVQFARLQRNATVLAEIFTLLQTRLKEAEIAQAVEDATIRVIDPAITSLEPIKPRRRLILVLGFLLGMIAGTSVAFLRDYMDSAVHTREDVQAATGLTVLGMIPRIDITAPDQNVSGSGKVRFDKRLVSGINPQHPVSEAYRALRTHITFMQPDRPPKSLVFTSPLPGEGKSTTSANLAITLTRQGHKVLLIDADLRRGVGHEVFGANREPGLSNILVAAGELERTIQNVDLGSGHTLDFMSTGTLPPNPAELVGSERMRQLLERLEHEYDMVILDAPPLNLVTDAALLGTNADGVVVVARAGQTESAGLAYAVEQLRSVRAPILGAVLNDIDFERRGQYYGNNGAYGAYQAYYGPYND